MYSIHPSYLGMWAEAKRRDALNLKGQGPRPRTVNQHPAGRKWRLLGR
jgi:hypothetical protein